MTLNPHDSWAVKLDNTPAYKVNAVCAHPHCSEPSTDTHHIWRRSATGAPAAWVKLDGIRIGNLVGLCRRHHDEVTGGIGGHKGWIRWHSDSRLFAWWKPHREVADAWTFVGDLDPQPPLGGVPCEAPGHDTQEQSGHTAEQGPCPTCGQPRRKAKPREPGKPKTRAVVTFPKDEQIVWDELLEEARLALERPMGTSPYYVIVEALVHLIQNRHLLTKGQ